MARLVKAVAWPPEFDSQSSHGRRKEEKTSDHTCTMHMHTLNGQERLWKATFEQRSKSLSDNISTSLTECVSKWSSLGPYPGSLFWGVPLKQGDDSVPGKWNSVQPNLAELDQIPGVWCPCQHIWTRYDLEKKFPGIMQPPGAQGGIITLKLNSKYLSGLPRRWVPEISYLWA